MSIFKPRLNFVDLVGIILAAIAVKSGYWIEAIFIWLPFGIASAIGQSAYERRGASQKECDQLQERR